MAKQSAKQSEKETAPEVSMLFECSWEVCNKIGGIYTVLSTKAKTLRQYFGDNVIFVGPDVWSAETPSPVFTPTDVVKLRGWAKHAAGALPYGIEARIGRWEVPGRPIAVLVKFEGLYKVKNEYYGQMWQRHGVDSLHAYGDYDEACAFGIASAIVIESIIEYLKLDPAKVVAHFDEWTTGMGLLHVKDAVPEAGTVFTTHATSIGRSICGNGKALYGYLPGYNGDQMAGELNMQSKHSVEKAAAHAAGAFTTVSGVTADECAQLLDKPVDVVTPNGFEPDFVPKGRNWQAARTAARTRMLAVARALTGAPLPDDTFIVATSGRCEYRNKGLDMYLDAIARLADSDPSRPILALVLVPAWVRAPRTDLRHALSLGTSEGLSDPWLTHAINNPDSDPVACRLRQLFENRPHSRAVCIYAPCYLNGTDGIFDMKYYDLLPGLDATVFASYYEPWGYTPLESVAFGVPTVTTTLAGFGRWVADDAGGNVDDDAASLEATGVAIVERSDFNYDQARDEIAVALRHIVNADAATAEQMRQAARATAEKAHWANFMPAYMRAYAHALHQE